MQFIWIGCMVLTATFNNIPVISWRSVLLVEEAGIPWENHRPVASHSCSLVFPRTLQAFLAEKLYNVNIRIYCNSFVLSINLHMWILFTFRIVDIFISLFQIKDVCVEHCISIYMYIYMYIKSKGIYQPENLMSNGSSRHDDAAQTK